MRIKTIKDEDFVNYKKASMFIGTATCDFKCCKEAGIPLEVCQNYAWNKNPSIYFPDEKIIERYLSNPITSAFVFGGLEPFDQWRELIKLISVIREKTDDDIVIYTGYKEGPESDEYIKDLSKFKNIIIKFGRYVPNQKPHYDEVLGVNLASDNQYGKKIS